MDLSHFLAGPFATIILGDLGADVLKIEPPTGDPVRNRPSTAWCRRSAGVMDLTGEAGGPPARVGYQIGHTAGGLWAAIAILAGLQGRNTDGATRHVEISLFDAQLSLLVWQAQDYLSHDVVYERMGTRHATFPPSQAFGCADGRYVYATPSAIPRWWAGYCTALDVSDNPQFAELADRQRTETNSSRS